MVSPDSKHVISTYCQRGVKRSLKELVVGENLLDFSFLEISGLHFSLLSSESSGGFRPCRQALAPCPLEWKTCPWRREQERAGAVGESGQRLGPESEDPGSECGAGKREPGRPHSFPSAHSA